MKKMEKKDTSFVQGHICSEKTPPVFFIHYYYFFTEY